MKRRDVDFDRVLIDWADEFIQDLVASFSARRPTTTLRVVVAGLYMFAAFHLIFAAILPFYRSAIGGAIGTAGSGIPPEQLAALATGIIIGGISYHLLMTVAYVLLSFVVRASRRWTRLTCTLVLGVNSVVALNGLRTDIAAIFSILQWMTLAFAGGIVVPLWSTGLAQSAQANRLPDGKGHAV